MKILIIAVTGLLGIVGIIVGIGFLLPREHQTVRSAKLNATPDTLWKIITDYHSYPSWRSDVTAIESIASENGKPAWIESGTHGRIHLNMVEILPNKKLVTQVKDPDDAFGGQWTFALEGQGDQTHLTITESGYVNHPVFRFVSKFVFGHTKTLESYLQALGNKFNQKIYFDKS